MSQLKETILVACILVWAVAVGGFVAIKVSLPTESLTAGGGAAGDVMFANRNALSGNEVASSSFAVSGTAVNVLPRNSGRIYASCSNNGSPSVFLALGGNASKSWGITVPASTSYQFKRNENLYVGPVYAITVGGSTRVSCIDVTAK